MPDVGRSMSKQDYLGQTKEIDFIVAPKSQPMYFAQPQASFKAVDYDYARGQNFAGNFGDNSHGLVSDSIEFVRFSQNSEKSPEGAGRRDGSNESWKSHGLRVNTGVCDSQERNAADIIRLVEHDLRN